MPVVVLAMLICGLLGTIANPDHPDRTVTASVDATTGRAFLSPSAEKEAGAEEDGEEDDETLKKLMALRAQVGEEMWKRMETEWEKSAAEKEARVKDAEDKAKDPPHAPETPPPEAQPPLTNNTKAEYNLVPWWEKYPLVGKNKLVEFCDGCVNNMFIHRPGMVGSNKPDNRIQTAYTDPLITSATGSLYNGVSFRCNDKKALTEGRGNKIGCLKDGRTTIWHNHGTCLYGFVCQSDIVTFLTPGVKGSSWRGGPGHANSTDGTALQEWSREDVFALQFDDSGRLNYLVNGEVRKTVSVPESVFPLHLMVAIFNQQIPAIMDMQWLSSL